ncbi:class I SAM-dependent methyltransferase [Saccharomonospora sp. NPDC006951]
MTPSVIHGDFSRLADDYSRFREGYSPAVRDAILGLLAAPSGTLDIADVGAGTGIWSRMLADREPRSIVAVEPNVHMRRRGEYDSAGSRIRWLAGSGERTGLAEASADLVTMASSFHWVDFPAGITEFARVLRRGGWFTALWNTRKLDDNPLLADIEAEITRLRPGVRRVSSGSSAFVSTLSEKLAAASGFGDLVYLEGRHLARHDVDRYLGLWRSANDVRAQLGEELFGRFLDFARKRLAGERVVETTYLTRAWAIRRD